MQHEYATRCVNARPPATGRHGRWPFFTWLLLCLPAGSAVFGQTLSPARNALNVSPTANVSVTAGPLSLSAANAIRLFSPQYPKRVFGTPSLTGGNTASFNPFFDFKPGETLFATIRAGGGLQKQAYQFTVAAGPGPGTFSGGSNLTMGDLSRTVVAADVDGDWDVDILTAHVAGGRVDVALNDGAGNFSATNSVPVQASPLGIAAADVDYDGDLDLLVANANSNSVSVRINDGTGAFSGSQNVSVGRSPFGVAAADVDADGDLDLLTANFTGNSVSVRFNDGAGTFSGAYDAGFGDGNGPLALAAGDVDNDGDLDVLTANAASNSVSVLRNDGNGTFSATFLAVGAFPGSIAAADVDGDRDLDVLTANANSSTISVRINDGAGAFSNAADVAGASGLRNLTTADVDGDGDLDVLATSYATSSVVIMRRNDGDGGFSSAPSVPVGASPYGIATADVDGDEDLDLLTANYGANSVSVRLNQPPPAVLSNANLNKSGQEDVLLAFTAADFTSAFSPAGTLAKVKFPTLPPAGTLKLGAADVTANQEIPVADLGTLVYAPAANYNGTVSFSWNGSNGEAYAPGAAQVNLTLAPVNDAPVLAPIGNREVNEGVTLTFPVSATDVDPADQIRYELFGAPSGARISSDGVFSWTPLERDGPGTFTFKVRARDSDNFLFFDEEEITVTVKEVNTPPDLMISQDGYTVNEGSQLTFGASGRDTDEPAVPLTFSLVGAPEGAFMDPATGLFSWTPTEAQGPKTYAFTVKLSDGTSEDNQQITVTVNEVNDLPSLTVPERLTVKELTQLTFAVTATDTDLPPNPLYFSLTGAPEGARIDPLTGVFSWTPTEAEGGTGINYRIGIGVADAENAAPVVFETVRVFVEEVNEAPVLSGFPMTLTADELAPLTFRASAGDPDEPGGPLTFSLVGAPAGATISPGGNFSWTPGETQGSNAYTFHVRVSDGRLSAEGQVTVNVNETNSKPVLTPVEALEGNEHAPLTFRVTATDPDVPANALMYAMLGAPAGATLDPVTGQFSWTPTEEQDGFFTFQLTVRDNGTPSLSDSWFVIGFVNEADAAPVLAPIGPRTVEELSKLIFTASATDADRADGVADVLTYSLVGAPAGAGIDPATGIFSWTPTEEQDGSFTFTVRVTDGTLSDHEQVTITVKEINTAPVLTLAAAPALVNEGVAFTLQATATDADVPANPLTFSLASAPAEATIDETSGLISWTPTEAQGNNTGYSFTVKVSDGALADEQTFSVLVKEVNAAPVLARIGSREVDEGAALAFQAAAADADLPANALTYTLVEAPAGATLTAGGAFSWTPTEAQGPGAFTFRVKVTDNGTPALSDEEEITVTVKEVNAAPVLAGVPAAREGAWGNATGFQATATDADVPANALTFSLEGAPAGAAIHPVTGAFSWTPTAGQIGSYTFGVKVTDDGTPSRSDEQTVTITVSKRATALAYNGAVTGQYSDQAGLSAVLTDVAGGLPGTPLPGKAMTFVLGTQSAGATTRATGVAAVPLKLDQPAVTVRVASNFAGDALYLPSADNDPFAVTREHADVVYAGLEYFATANASSSLANVEYVATLTDKADDSRGVITNALAAFSGNPGRTVNVSLVNPADPTVGGGRTGVFTEKLTSSEYSSGGKTYPVEVSAGGSFYTGQTTTTTLITIAVPGADYVNGGGNLVITQSAGTYAATAGSKMNFGFTMKWNKSGKNIQGQVNIIFRRLVNGVWRTYQIKSNAINTLGTFNVAGGRRADFNTKANVTDVTSPLSPVSLGGGLDLTVQAFEATDRASKNQISVIVRNGNVLVFSSYWNGSAFLMQPLNGGAIRVRSNTTIAAVAGRQDADAAAGTVEAPAAFAVRAYPSPFADAFTLHIGSAVTGDVAITVTDGKGRTVTRRVEKATGGSMRTVEINLINEDPGVYMLHVQSGSMREVIKVFKISR
jgi:hypothetical protein